MGWMDNDNYDYYLLTTNSVRCQAHEEKGRIDFYIRKRKFRLSES